MYTRRFRAKFPYRVYLMIVLIFVVVIFGFSYFMNRNTDSRIEVTIPPDMLTKKCILYYNSPEWMSQGYNTQNFDTCNYTNCRLTTIRSEISRCDVVIFQHFALPLYPPKKELFQKWIFTSSENPYNTYPTCRKRQWKTSFDMVMSYRRDSDVFFGYGDIIPRKAPVEKDYDSIFHQKDKDVAWIVSHCKTDSKREQYVQEMKKVIDIDIFGKCGEKYCDIYKGNENDTCHDVVGKKYKFYLSFENAICKDYTTEKLYFIYAFDHNIIPVVRGAFNSKAYLPKEGAIYTDDFKSPTHLGRYLKEIGSDKERYIKLLRQKDRYTAKRSSETFTDSLCSVCEKINTFDKTKPNTNLDIEKWWWHNTCQEPRDFNVKYERGEVVIKNLSQFKSILANFINL